MYPSNSRNPDDALVPLFRNHAVLNPARTAAEGRPIYDDVEVVDLRVPGSRNFGTHPATAVSGWYEDPDLGPVKITYAERFRKQYQQFKAHNAQTKTGTPLEHVPFLTEGRRAELRAQNIYTVEQLAAVDGQELRNLGPGGRDDKNRAHEFIDEAKKTVPDLQVQAELEVLRARNELLEADNELLKQRNIVAEGQFEDMSEEQLRKYIETNTGHMPQGSLPKKSLIMMAMNSRPPNKAA